MQRGPAGTCTRWGSRRWRSETAPTTASCCASRVATTCRRSQAWRRSTAPPPVLRW